MVLVVAPSLFWTCDDASNCCPISGWSSGRLAVWRVGVIAARWLLLFASCLLWCAVLGVGAPHMPATLQWLVASAGAALLAPLFWPGLRGMAPHAALRVVGWSAAAAVVAVLSVLLLGTGERRMQLALPASSVLLGLLVASHALMVLMERHWRHRGADADSARELAGRATVFGLVCLGATPLWCGPAAELLGARQGWAVDAAVGVSPLTHLAVASGSDLLRTDWFYQHANLAALQFDYPAPALLAGIYVALAALLAGAVHIVSRRREPAPAPASLS